MLRQEENKGERSVVAAEKERDDYRTPLPPYFSFSAGQTSHGSTVNLA
jgi:hypothetical protein